MTATWQGSCATSRRSWIGSLHLPRELPVNIPFSFHMATWARSRRNVYFGLVYKFTPSLSPSREALLRPLVPLFVPFWGRKGFSFCSLLRAYYCMSCFLGLPLQSYCHQAIIQSLHSQEAYLTSQAYWSVFCGLCALML